MSEDIQGLTGHGSFTDDGQPVVETVYKPTGHVLLSASNSFSVVKVNYEAAKKQMRYEIAKEVMAALTGRLPHMTFVEKAECAVKSADYLLIELEYADKE